jgi:hypothetical protein
MDIEPEVDPALRDEPSFRLRRIILGDPNDPEHFPGVLYKKGEIAEGERPPDAVLVQGITMAFGFHPTRLKESQPEVEKIILEVVADPFLDGTGGGYPFLALCEDRNGNQWGEHRSMEELGFARQFVFV